MRLGVLGILFAAGTASATNTFEVRPPSPTRTIAPPVAQPPPPEPSPLPWAIAGGASVAAVAGFAWAFAERRRRRLVTEELHRRKDYEAVVERNRQRAEKRAAAK
jgi:hypothetical protein